MISYENISLRVRQQTLLQKADLNVQTGDKLVIRGPSGCGKSTFLKATVGAVPYGTGTIQVDTIRLSAETVADIRSRVAFIGQEPLLGAERVQDAIMLPFQFKSHAHNRPEKKDIVQILDRLQLPQTILEKPCKYISGGEKQRIVILRAILLQKTIFLADEVTSALDPRSKACVMDELFRPDITLLSVSHDPEWVAACGRKVVIRNAGLEEVA